MNNEFIVYFDDSFAGNGKTTRAIEALVATPIRAIYCCEQNEKMNEIEKLIKAKAGIAGTRPFVRSINYLTATSVRKSVSDIPNNFFFDHVIILITHTALLSSDTTGFGGWQLVIDEVPSMLIHDEIKTPLAYEFLSKYFTLTAIDKEWSKIGLTPAGRKLKASDVATDDIMQFDSLYRAVIRSEMSDSNIVARLQNWDQASDGKQWFVAHWFSFFDVASFDKVSVLGNGFTSSVAVQLVRKKDDEIAAQRGVAVKWIPLHRPASATKTVPRCVTIRYFDENHATRTKMSTPIGKEKLAKVAEHLANVLPADAIWSANNSSKIKDNNMAVMTPFMRDSAISPRQAGSNLYRHCHAAAIIYSANPSPNMVAFLTLNKIDADAYRATQEHETILQFVTRTSIRDADSDHDVDFYVMDKFDAEYLEKYFADIGHDVPEPEFIDLGFEVTADGRTVERNITKKLGRPKLEMTAAERAEHVKELGRKRTAEKRRKDRAAKLAA